MKKSCFFRLLIVCFAGFLNLAFAQADRYRQIEALFHSCDKPDTPGGFAAAVIKDGTVIFKKAYGYANFENKIPFTTTTVVDYASVSKQFTGFAVASLIQENRLHLTDDIRDYLPEVPDFGTKITIDHLLHHTSGIRDWVGLVKISGKYEDDVITQDFLMKLMKNQKELNFKPGEKSQYSNMGYFLLANIVSRVTGKSFREWTREYIFKPLQMNDTHFSDDYREIIINRADSYRRDISGDYLNCPSHTEGYGSSSLFSTLDDMIKWVQNFGSKTVGGEELWKMMLEGGILNDGKKIDYGFGLDLGSRYGQRSFGHGGSWCGALSQVTYYPDHKLGTILITNRDPSGVNVEESILKLFLDEKEEKVSGKSEAAPKRTERKIDSELLQDYAGIYKLQNWIISVEKVDDDLVIHQPWGEGYKVYPESDHQFFHQSVDIKYSFLRDHSGKVDRMIYRFKGEDNPPFLKLDSGVSGYPDIKDLCGDYTSGELKTTYTIKIQNNRLIVEHLQNENVSLVRIDKDHYIGDQWWFKNLVLVRDENQTIMGFKLNADTDNIQNLWFERK